MVDVNPVNKNTTVDLGLTYSFLIMKDDEVVGSIDADGKVTVLSNEL